MLGGSRELGRWDTGSVTLQLGFRGLRGIFGIFLGFKADLKGCCGDFREEFGGLLGIFGGFKGGFRRNVLRIFGWILANLKEIYGGFFVYLWEFGFGLKRDLRGILGWNWEFFWDSREESQDIWGGFK